MSMDTEYTLEVRIAEIVDTPIPLDMRYQVRIMPDMADIQETTLLPKYPAFFITESVAAQKGEYVWVVCNQDFSLGYVMGLASPATPIVSEAYTNESMKYMFESIFKEVEKNVGLQTSKFNDVFISHFNEHMLDLYNTTNGRSATIYKNGMYFIMDADRRMIRYGIDALTYIQMRKGEINLVADTITFNGKVCLGPGGNPILTAEMLAGTSYTMNGITFKASKNGRA